MIIKKIILTFLIFIPDYYTYIKRCSFPKLVFKYINNFSIAFLLFSLMGIITKYYFSDKKITFILYLKLNKFINLTWQKLIIKYNAGYENE